MRHLRAAGHGPEDLVSKTRYAAGEVLAAYGIAVLPAAHAGTGVSAVAAAERLGYPVIVMPAGRTAGPGRCDAGRPALRSEADLTPLLAGPTGVVAGNVRLRLTGTPANR
ncbi:hypothetical protein FHR83_009220 [Actinoplanes campanulatus]|uniref:ATP-grasp domain-containing protein n=1 Tax=Actinoplanes campanulatus TaxID=113559 RepID=A0A7W5ASA3_9ACTN|nr:hypothetical protein [Actinoplanes campanulatus]MBB3101491.1 hypothetical protein [Actinoplanes campanulatus]GGN50594.1 hypothetical protein GCM10010109_89910 [Actinoplanes campanulatus]GID42086.1 hypothetical protein Aca09nite_85920 [Actinoplanes campanulatus]